MMRQIQRLVLGTVVVAAVAGAGAWPLHQAAGASPDTTHCVNRGGTHGCFNTIQGAVNAAANGDIITIAAGTYSEDVTISKNLTLIGAGSTGNLVTTVQSPDQKNTILVTAGATVSIRSLVAQNGGCDFNNAGALTLTDVVATVTPGFFSTNGILNNGVVQVIDSRLYNNAGAGRGMYNQSGTAVLIGTVVSSNWGGILNYGTLNLISSAVGRNTGGGIGNQGTMNIDQSSFVSENGPGGSNNCVGNPPAAGHC